MFQKDFPALTSRQGIQKYNIKMGMKIKIIYLLHPNCCLSLTIYSFLDDKYDCSCIRHSFKDLGGM